MASTQLTKQWRMTATQLQIGGGVNNPAGTVKRRYLSANLVKTAQLFLIIEAVEVIVGGNGALIDRVNKRVVTFDDVDVFNFLIAAGETLPPVNQRTMNYTPAGSRGNTEDEVVVTDGTTIGSL